MIVAISPFLFFLTQVNAATLQPPLICDVTTKMFSVVWTTEGTYTSCGIKLYTDGSHSTEVALNPNQIIMDTTDGQPGEDGKDFGIAKVSVVGLDYGTTYHFGVTQDSGTPFHYSEVTTESLRGLASNDPNDHDIVSNDVVHKAVFKKADGTSPALGALVLADIYDSSGTTQLSDYSVSAWVGDGLPGGESTTYDPNNPSYKQYALIEMNNLFGGYASGDNYKFPLQLQGAEMIKFTIVCGTQEILGKSTEDPNHYVISWGRVESIDKVNGEPIMMPKVSASFKFTKGLNCFSLPFKLPEGYTTGDLLKDIDRADGVGDNEESHVIYIYLWDNNGQRYNYPTYKAYNPVLEQYVIEDSEEIQAGQGCFIIMAVDMTGEVTFYGKPESVSVRLRNGNNLVTFTQLPAYYTTENLLLDIEARLGQGSVQLINVFDNKQKDWQWPTTRYYNPVTEQWVTDSVYFMQNAQFYFAKIVTTSDVTSWDPFSN
ncbi:MAG: hypothetical protein ACMUIL_03935 [bacterium]